MAGLIGNAPIYVNGLVSLLFVFVLPGLACAPLLKIPGFPHRWFAIFLTSLIANHLLVTLIAAFHLDPLLSYRVAAGVVVVALALPMIARARQDAAGATLHASDIRVADIGWFLASLVALAATYFNLWKHGVPSIFDGSDPLVSWNAWALIWSQGNFPTASYGYPQLIPTLWAVPYIFTGSPAQYFAFYIYVGLIMLPILLNAMVLGRISWWHPLVAGFAFVWFMAEIRTPWLRSTLSSGFPDWVAVIFASSGVVLFAVSAPDGGRLDREKITSALLALGLVSLAATIKPLHGLLALAILAGICTDAWKYLQPADRNRVMAAAAGLLSILVVLYAIYYAHLQSVLTGLPVPSALGERLTRALDLFNSTFTIPFRIVFVLGLLICPFVKRLRWFALPLYVAIGTWANTAAYDLRNILSFLLIGVFVVLYAAARRWLEPKAPPPGRQWLVRDGLVGAIFAAAMFVLTSPLVMSDPSLQRRFADDQLRIDAGLEHNQKVGELLARGCRVFTSTASIYHIVAFAPFKGQLEFFFYTLPVDDSLTKRLNGSAGCTAILYPPGSTHPSILGLIADYRRTHDMTKLVERNGMELLVSRQ
jgi:hypothetical protein